MNRQLEVWNRIYIVSLFKVHDTWTTLEFKFMKVHTSAFTQVTDQGMPSKL